MIATTHFLTGAAIVSVVPNLYLSLPLSFLSHFVLDKIPHSQSVYKPWRVTRKVVITEAIDLVIAISSIYFLTSALGKPNHLWLGAIASSLPDLDFIFYLNPFRHLLKNKILKVWTNFHESIQNETKKFLGILTQLLIITLSLALIYKYAKN